MMPAALSDIVKRYAMEQYPRADVVIWGGSSAAGDTTSTSDVDLVVFEPGINNVYRIVERQYGRLFEVLLLSPEHYSLMLEEARKSAIPSIVRMCRDGIPIVGQERAADIVAQAQEVWEAGPYPLTAAELDRYRYEISDQLADWLGRNSAGERLFIAARLLEQLAEFIMHANRRWLGAGKWAYRELESWNPYIAGQLCEAFDRWHETDDKLKLVKFARSVLAPYGGMLRDGWVEGKTV